jgi:raffinose/stachyose/melibiose transport system substrate-binding protein
MKGWGKAIPVSVLALTFVWSCVAILTRRVEEAPPGSVVIRICHWQLETGVRDAFDQMAEEYQRLHPNVRIVQEAIPETTYGQWMTTQLIGGTAPDLMEMGKGLSRPVLVSYFNRYFVPISQYANRPNPYNRGTELEGVPLRQTYKDGMRVGYIEEMQEYMMVPVSMFGIRVFYNRDLYTRLTGRTDPPLEYRDFLEVCRQIASQTGPDGSPYVPVAGSVFHMLMWEGFMFDPITYSVLYDADLNRDGYQTPEELYTALASGRLDFDHPAIRARFEMIREVSNHFQTGFTGLTRDEAVFLFAQQRAVFINTGTWDARSLREQTEGAFDVGVMGFPMPAPDDPEYGDLVLGPVFEVPGVGFPFAINRDCAHFEQALDFLLFLTSREGNERMNQIIGWIPAIEGAESDDLLREFEPSLEGMYPAVSTATLSLGGETFIRHQQLYALYQVGQITFDQFADQYLDFYMNQGIRDWNEMQRDWVRGIAKDAHLTASLRARILNAEDEEDTTADWIKYRDLVWQRQVGVTMGRHDNARMMEGGGVIGAPVPYRHSLEALERVRRRLADRVLDAGEDGP